MSTKHKIEVFTAGCSACKETIDMVTQLAGSAHELVIHDMHKREIASRAKQQRIHRVPAVVIDGKLAECCGGWERGNPGGRQLKTDWAKPLNRVRFYRMAP